MTNLSLWNDQVVSLQHRYNILRYDQRGHGATDVPSEDCTFDQLAGDLAVLFDAFSIRKAALVGVSMGGITALRFASLHPERLTSLVISDATASTAPGAQAAWDERIALAEAGGMVALAQPTIDRWFTKQSVLTEMAAIPRVRTMIAQTPIAGFKRAAAALRFFDFEDDLARIQCPTLMIAGSADGALPATMRTMSAHVPASQFVEIEGAGHLPNIEQPDMFTSALESFLAGVS